MTYINPITACDFYKVGHKAMYPAGTTKIYSNLTPRSGKHSKTGTDEVLFFGLQGFIKSFLINQFNENFFNRPRAEVVAEYDRRMNTSLGEGSVDSSHIGALHDLGYLPIQIKALPEGSLVPVKVPMLTITNTHPEFYWLVNYLETALSAELWKSTTTATTAFAYRQLFTSYAKLTGSPLDFVVWQGHDFSLRGISGLNDSQSAAGHLLSFLGTDTIPAIDYLERYYKGKSTFVGGSVPATEHSVMSAGGKESEEDTIRRLITKVVPSGVVSVVSDTWDFWNVITVTAANLKPEILSRKPNALGLAKVVFRPDSGDPADIICGTASRLDRDVKSLDALDEVRDFLIDMQDGDKFSYLGAVYECTGKQELIREYGEDVLWDIKRDIESYTEQHIIKQVPAIDRSSPAAKGAVQCLWDIFGGTTTSTGHRVLNERVGLIYGDSITLEVAKDILDRLDRMGFASCNIVFGIGSYTYQYVTRDTWGFAVKATYAEVNGEARELFKDPITDNGTKKSARGLLRVERDHSGAYVLHDRQTKEQEKTGELQTVFMNGMVWDVSLDEIRAKVNSQL